MNEAGVEVLGPGRRMVEGRFEILRVIGEGGWATVYLARECEGGRLVALKVLSLRSDDEATLASFQERFEREAQAASRIAHPNIVAVHEVGVLCGREQQPYLVMEYLEGHDLAQELARHGALTLERTLRLMLPVVSALARAHECGIVHRDLKPANLFLVSPGAADERLVVVDFGIARLSGQASRLTERAALFGTPAYLSPEWIEHRQAAPAMDVYQLGLILAEMLTGEPVVSDELLYQCLRRHVSGTLELPPALLEGPLGPVLRRALAREVGERYADARALERALASCVARSLATERTTCPATAPAELLIEPSATALPTLERHAFAAEATTLAACEAPPSEATAWRIGSQSKLLTLAPGSALLSGGSPLRATVRRGRWPQRAALAAVLVMLALSGWWLASLPTHTDAHGAATVTTLRAAPAPEDRAAPAAALALPTPESAHDEAEHDEAHAVTLLYARLEALCVAMRAGVAGGSGATAAVPPSARSTSATTPRRKGPAPRRARRMPVLP